MNIMYQEAKIKSWILDDFWPDYVALIIATGTPAIISQCYHISC